MIVHRWTARLVPLTVDGLIYASSMVLLDSARRRALARWLLGLSIATTLAANMAYGLIGAAAPRGLRWRWWVLRAAHADHPQLSDTGRCASFTWHS